MSLSNGEHKRREIAVLEALFSLKNLERERSCARRRALGSPQQGLLVPVSGDFYRGHLQHLTLAARRVVFREIVRVDKREHRKGGENHE
jgi:hypothetical protein